ncbi:MAG TPA: hypothetical protein VM489_06585 [Burkholderiales bacterium]|nr:hypothetical protein [Burkholderiales bacterium]
MSPAREADADVGTAAPAGELLDKNAVDPQHNPMRAKVEHIGNHLATGLGHGGIYFKTSRVSRHTDARPVFRYA